MNQKEVDELKEKIRRYELALNAIVEDGGPVCQYHLLTGCAHRACGSSRTSWTLANDALYPMVLVSSSN